MLPFLIILPAVALVAAGPPPFAKVAGDLKFSINGTSKYFAGTNAYWLPFTEKNADIDLVFSHIKESGMKVVRTWGFNDINTKPSESKSPVSIPPAKTLTEVEQVWFQSFIKGEEPKINVGKYGLQRLDYVVKSAEAHGISLIIAFVNNWKDYGGMPTYMDYYRYRENLANPGRPQQPANPENNSYWYHSKPAQQQYKKYINAVVDRYKSSSAIFAWELCNEPRCKGCNTDVVANWASDTAKYIKRLDSRHMVALGDEGFGLTVQGENKNSYPFQYGEGTDFAKNLKIKELDFGTFHFYPGSWSVKNDFGKEWVQTHAEVCAALGKPCVFEEFGVTSQEKCLVEREWQKASRNTKGMAGDMFWQYGDKLSFGDTHNDGNTIYWKRDNYKCVVDDHVKEIG